MDQSSVEFSTSEYIKRLSSPDCSAVYSKRAVPAWINELSLRIQEPASEPLQIWLINEDVSNLEKKLEEGLSAFGMQTALKEQLTQDTLFLTHWFSELTNDVKPFVSLRTIDERYFENEGVVSVSKDWHIDTSVLTLSCTYVGRGTEWVTNAEKYRPLFDTEKMPRSITFDALPGDIHEMGPAEISVIKGEIRSNEDAHASEFLSNFLSKEEITPFNVGHGLLHRGPGFKTNDSRRLLLTVSTMRVPPWLKT